MPVCVAEDARSPGAEAALGEGGDEADFDEEPDDGLKSRQHCHRIIQAQPAWKEAAPVEGCQAEDGRLQRAKRIPRLPARRHDRAQQPVEASWPCPRNVQREGFPPNLEPWIVLLCQV
jgi:hypothetical protein